MRVKKIVNVEGLNDWINSRFSDDQTMYWCYNTPDIIVIQVGNCQCEVNNKVFNDMFSVTNQKYGTIGRV